eukprot:TRINITY_DN15337_c0_g1_i1.p1 TRINITY_DN15337_c0_g1~~TRINITY_DN15337_c0_g1_i1.p1  ORF type:complete len:344 (+),score=74.30 TRINITY_DN15337_c0_g1_i1:46-1077(+)
MPAAGRVPLPPSQEAAGLLRPQRSTSRLSFIDPAGPFAFPKSPVSPKSPKSPARPRSGRRRSSVVPVLPQGTDVEKLLRTKNPPRDAVIRAIDAADDAVVSECLSFLHAWQQTREAAWEPASGDLRAERKSAANVLQAAQDADDDICLVRWHSPGAAHAAVFEVLCWECKLRTWRANPQLSFKKVLVDNVLYSDYERSEVRSPGEVMAVVGKRANYLEAILNEGVVVPLSSPGREAPCWADAIVSDAPGLRNPLPWGDLFAAWGVARRRQSDIRYKPRPVGRVGYALSRPTSTLSTSHPRRSQSSSPNTSRPVSRTGFQPSRPASRQTCRTSRPNTPRCVRVW